VGGNSGAVAWSGHFRVLPLEDKVTSGHPPTAGSHSDSELLGIRGVHVETGSGGGGHVETGRGVGGGGSGWARRWAATPGAQVAISSGGHTPHDAAAAIDDDDDNDNDVSEGEEEEEDEVEVEEDDDAPSELLAPLLEEWCDVLVTHVLAWLDPTDCALLSQVGKPWLAVVVANNLPRAGKGGVVRLKLSDFVGSVEMLEWASDNGCPWNVWTSETCAAGGHVEVLQWAREHGCSWNATTCARAAEGGHIEVLRWAREHRCPWDGRTCASAAQGGHLQVLRWAWENYCPWDKRTCENAAGGGHLEVLEWARSAECPWNAMTCKAAAWGGHLETLQWARQHHCPWNEAGRCRLTLSNPR